MYGTHEAWRCHRAIRWKVLPFFSRPSPGMRGWSAQTWNLLFQSRENVHQWYHLPFSESEWNISADPALINTKIFFNYDLWPFDSLTNLRVSIKHTLKFSSKWVYTTRIKAELCYLILMWTFNSLKNVPTEFPYFQTQQKMWLGEDGDICGLLQKIIANY